MIRRILFSESSLNLGGQELQLLQQMGALQNRGVKVLLACHPGSAILQRAQQLGINVAPVIFRHSLDWSSILQLRALLRRWETEAVICHSGHDASVCGLAARLVRPRPRVVRVRTYQHGMPRAWTYNWLADRTLVPSLDLRARILRHPRIRPERIHLLYPGFPFAELSAQAALPLPPAIGAWLDAHPGPLLAHAAMLRPEKGHMFMLDVLAALLPAFPGLRYVIAGEGGERAALESRIAALGLTEHVLLAGMMQSVAPLLRRAQIVVMPSFIEPLGMAQSEALALGTPVIASRVGGIPETVRHGETGLLVAPGDLAAWREAVAWGLEHAEELRAMAAAGRSEVLVRFSIESNVERFLALIAAIPGAGMITR